MRSHIRKFLSLLPILAVAAPALADDITVPAGRTSPIGFYYTYSHHTCYYGNKPEFKLTKAPEHGTVKAVWKGYRMGKEARNCNGKPMYGMLILYSPNKGYHGKDVVKFGLSGSGLWPGATYSVSRGFKTNITVK